jgi:hypothetical protein
MSKEQITELAKLLKSFDKQIIDLVMWLRDFAWDLCPEANELIYDNYNALAIGWSVTDKVGHNICSIAIYRSNQSVHFGFYWGNELSDLEKILLGQGNQYRYILVTDKKKFPKVYIRKLVNEAYVNSLAKVKDPKQIIHGQTIIKSISEKKRPERVTKTIKPKKK